MDLDNFKFVNDQHGHLAGSQVLREVGFVLKRTLQRIESAIVSRYGGDEFVIILPGYTLSEARSVAEDVCSVIAGTTFLPHDYGFGLPAVNLKGVLSASVGVASYRPDPASVADPEAERNDLLRRADGAMYEAKARGKNQVIAADNDAFQGGKSGVSDPTRITAV